MSEQYQDLTDFLIELAQSPKLMRAFKEDPRRVMDEAGLSEEEQKILSSGDPVQIRDAVDQDRVGDKFLTIIFITDMPD